MSKLLLRLMVVMAPLVLVINGLTKGDWLSALLFSLSVAVGLTPEMLPMIVTTCLAKGAVDLSHDRVIVKRLDAIQNLGAMDVLCTDKTGTLTEDHVVLERHLDLMGNEDSRVLRYAFLNSFFETGVRNLIDSAIITRASEETSQGGRDKAKAMVEDTTGTTTADQKAIAKQLSGFTVKADGTINLAKDATDTTNDKTFAAKGDGQGLTLQIGDTSATYNKMNVKIENCHTAALGIKDLSVADQAGAAEAVAKIKDAINTVSGTRGDLGALQNRLEHTSNNLSVMTENIQDAESTIRDTDVAEEMMSYTKNNILIQSAQAMLAQANQVPQGVLQLLQ
mgnify:CR=1 FL=1